MRGLWIISGKKCEEFVCREPINEPLFTFYFYFLFYFIILFLFQKVHKVIK